MDLASPHARLPILFQEQQQHKAHLRQTTASARITQLKRLRKAVYEQRYALRRALQADFGKPGVETDFTEIFPLLKEIDHVVRHLKDWMEPHKVSTPLALIGSRAFVQYEPKGVVLIMAPWNYPFYLQLSPLVSALAAGNAAILKPSEMTPHTAAFIRQLIETLFPPEEVAVVEGGKDVAEALLALPFDHIFFTGSPEVGKVVMAAAAQHLTSVTLELGGKSPVVVDETADVADAARKIAWGKYINAGQTCIAPDYLLVHEHQRVPMLEALRTAFRQMYDEGGYARIINERHFQRLKTLLEQAQAAGAVVEEGGTIDATQRLMAPTVLTGMTEAMRLMQEEIFGPLLPVVFFRSLEEAVACIERRPKPLSLYIFSRNERHIDYLLHHTSAGGTAINETILHVANPRLPFGGVNHSGLGKSHGHWGFLAFSNERSVLRQRVGLSTAQLSYPPYTSTTEKISSGLLKYG
ncbi:aldehyde dehydrogenase (NAD+) [Catalinimonas alkaloidigena]|uniref:Aldehyde dehydrogenase n=1 Tax=Catalinimonas alkaloidigena TaxID=1075417 RepID=A0A1G9M556_9BACT|nr:aldehyde dehydrogenase family protein [Catalinimonas alkaloidigena]SDL69328.1 aldehyde dehydrogenase (NAD+) [Catalinimonas alkaloidigena]